CIMLIVILLSYGYLKVMSAEDEVLFLFWQTSTTPDLCKGNALWSQSPPEAPFEHPAQGDNSESDHLFRAIAEGDEDPLWFNTMQTPIILTQFGWLYERVWCVQERYYGFLSCIMPTQFLAGSMNQAIQANPISAMPSSVCNPGVS